MVRKPRSLDFLSAQDDEGSVLDSLSNLEGGEESGVSEEVLDSAAESFGVSAMRSKAMAAVLAFIEEGDYSFSALDALIQGVSDLDGDGETTEEEEDLYNDMMISVMSAMEKLGADKDSIASFMSGESDKAGEKLGASLFKNMNNQVLDDASLIGRFAVSEEVESALILDASERRIVGGKVKWVRKKLKRKKATPAQKRALKKARLKANTGQAKLNRKRSNKIRDSRGM